MYIVYNWKEDSPDCGWSVESEEEAIRQCDENPDLNYIYRMYGPEW